MKAKKVYAYAGLAAVLLAMAFWYYHANNKGNDKKTESSSKPDISIDKIVWMVDNEGYLAYPLERGAVSFRRDNHSQTENLSVSRIVYESNNANIYGLLVLPKSASELLPGVVLLPGAGVSKESELRLAEKIAGLGAAVLTIDQRGVGETGGYFPPLDEDYTSFLNAKEPYQHLMVYDALRAYDLLSSAPFIDSERIIMAGESLGGRVAVIASAIDKNIKGALVISSSGLNLKEDKDQKKDAFLKSIDSDHYLNLISPRKIVMMHNAYDKNIPLESALISFSNAHEPKQFVLVNDTSCNHGYCDIMYSGLVSSFNYLVK